MTKPITELSQVELQEVSGGGLRNWMYAATVAASLGQAGPLLSDPIRIGTPGYAMTQK